MDRRALLGAGLATLLAGCVSAGPRIAPPPGAGFEELEPLYAVSAGRQAVTISVASSGCTRKEDFAFFAERIGEGVRLSFGRRRLDTCQSFAMRRTDLVFTYAELGVPERATIFVLNPVTAWTGPGS